VDDYDCYSLEGRDCVVCIVPRPAYCDRGNFVALLDVKAGGNALRLGLDGQDGWPRYYMDLERAKAEIQDWLKKRKQELE